MLSPVAERLLSAQLRERLGPAANQVVVASAGTAAGGPPMDRIAAETLRSLFGNDGGFGVRQLTAGQVRSADLLLTATREHRAAAVRLAPEASKRAFLLREFSRLTAAVDPAALPDDGDVAARLRAAVAEAAALRGYAVPPASKADDLPDPCGTGWKRPAQVAEMVVEATTPIAEMFAAVSGRDVGAGRVAESPYPAPVPDRGWVVPERRETRTLVRRLGFVALVPAVGALATAGVLGWRVWQVRGDLHAAQRAALGVSAKLLAGNLAGAGRDLSTMQRHAGNARRAASGPVWRTASALPYAGDDLAAIRRVTIAVDDVATSVLPPLAEAGGEVRPNTLRISGDRFDLGAIERAAPSLQSAAERSARIRDAVAGIGTSGLVRPVRNGVRATQETTTRLANVTSAAATAARLLPDMLGARGERRYFVAVQNPAEARGTGGLLGAYGVLAADKGRVRMLQLGANSDLEQLTEMPLDLGQDFRNLYGDDPALWVNANMSAHFPYAARLWLEMWRRQTGQRLDGVVAADPVAMSYVLRATGPVTLPSGEQVTAGNAVRLTLRDAYARFSADNQRRDAFLQQIAREVFAKLSSGAGDPSALAGALARSAGERRLLVYSEHAREQRRLADTVLGGALPDAPGPFAGVVVNNAGGNKIDYYLRRDLRYSRRGCLGGQVASRIDVTLTNTAPRRGLPTYVTVGLDQLKNQPLKGKPHGTGLWLVNVYAARGAQLVASTRDGRPLAVFTGRERGHPVFRTRLTLEGGETARLAFELVEPPSASSPHLWRQPLVLPVTTQEPRRDLGLPCRG